MFLVAKAGATPSEKLRALCVQGYVPVNKEEVPGIVKLPAAWWLWYTTALSAQRVMFGVVSRWYPYNEILKAENASNTIMMIFFNFSVCRIGINEFTNLGAAKLKGTSPVNFKKSLRVISFLIASNYLLQITSSSCSTCLEPIPYEYGSSISASFCFSSFNNSAVVSRLVTERSLSSSGSSLRS